MCQYVCECELKKKKKRKNLHFMYRLLLFTRQVYQTLDYMPLDIHGELIIEEPFFSIRFLCQFLRH